MVITIDGPAGAGKSTVARRLAERLGFEYLDTGAMYRAVALASIRAGVRPDDEVGLAQLAARIDVQQGGGVVRIDGEDVTEAIRQDEVGQTASLVAAYPAVRARMVELQRRCAQGRSIVTEGRDQGTVVFPDAAWKLFLTATPEVRAQRRQVELEQRGETKELAEVRQEIDERDRRDSTRAVGPLARAADAIEVDTSGMSIAQVVEKLVQLTQTTE